MTDNPLGIEFVHGDAFAHMEATPDNSIDMVCTDMPYESLEKHRKQGGTTGRLIKSTKSSNPWFQVIPNWKLVGAVLHLYRVLKPGRHAYLFCDDETSDVISAAADAAGFIYKKRLVWDKGSMGMGYHYRNRFEFVYFLVKGPKSKKRKLASMSVESILTAKRIVGGYPTEKPVEGLLGVFVTQSAMAGELVYDPFCGSGSMGVACGLHGVRFLGVDINARALDFARYRAFQLWLQQERALRAA